MLGGGWSTHGRGSVPRIYTERGGITLGVTLNYCVMRRCYLGEGRLVSSDVEIDILMLMLMLIIYIVGVYVDF